MENGDRCDISYFFSGTFAPPSRLRKTSEPARALTLNPSPSTMNNAA